MLFDIRNLFSTFEDPVTQSFKADVSMADFPGYTVPEPVAVCFTASISGSILNLSLTMEGVQCAECARCLDMVHSPFTVVRDYVIRDEEWRADAPELPFTADGKLNMQELVYTELVLELPTVLLCREDCEGICPVCGHRKPCTCKHETSDTIDPRLSILQKLIQSN